MESSSAARLKRAAAFLESNARALEMRLFEAAFRDGDPERVLGALEVYRNADGGYGLALEPDLRAPSSQPIHVHVALSTLREAGLAAPQELEGICDYLASVADENGAVPYVLPDALDHPRAGHWQGDFALAPSLHATAGVTAGLHALGARHAWLSRASTWCLEQASSEPTYSGHTILNVLDLLASMRPDARADRLWARVTGRLFEADHVLLETPVRTYGLTPLRFAPTPKAPLRPLFSDAQIEGHLEHLAASQQADGGWPIFWTPPEGGAVAAWRARWTLDALLVLRAYGR